MQAKLPVEYEDGHSVGSVATPPGSPRSTGSGEPTGKRGKKMLRKLKSVFKSGGDRGV